MNCSTTKTYYWHIFDELYFYNSVVASFYALINHQSYLWWHLKHPKTTQTIVELYFLIRLNLNASAFVLPFFSALKIFFNMLSSKVFSKPTAVAAQKIAARSFATATSIPVPAPVEQKTIFPKKYGGKYTVTLIPGDGIGQELASSVKDVFKAANVPVEFEQYDVSGLTSEDDKLFQESIASLRRNKVGIKGTLFTPTSKLGHKSFNVTMRKDLDMYASLSLCKNFPGVESRLNNVDIAIIRENTEGEYSGLEHQSVPGVVESLKIITRAKTERIARFAFDFAVKNNRKKVTIIHKANIMKLADGLFLRTCRDVAKEYEHHGIEYGDMIVDNTAMQLVSRPQQFDVMVMPNLYGNIVSNVGAGLIGSPGLIPGCNIGREFAMFEPGCRHVALDIQNQNSANPTAMLLSSVMMLRHLNLDEHANRISSAVYGTIQSGTARTVDIGGKSTTKEFTNAVIKAL